MAVVKKAKTSARKAQESGGDYISVRGATINNLKSVDVDIPHGRISAITGVSGAGKSSLVLDTVYSEGSRRYVQSMSVYARQFLERRSQAPVDSISGLLPAIAITPVNPTVNARSTVGTVTEVMDLLRLLFARAGDYRCSCGRKLERWSPASAAAELIGAKSGQTLLIAFPFGVGADFGGEREFSRAMDSLRAAGFRRLFHGGGFFLFDRAANDAELFARLKACRGGLGRFALVVVDRLRIEAGRRKGLVSSVKTAMHAGGGCMAVCPAVDGGGFGPAEYFFDRYECADCGRVVRPVSEHELSFNSPAGACPECRGFGRVIEIDPERVVPDTQKSLAKGAIAPWNSPAARRMFYKLKKAAAENGIDMDAPFCSLCEEHRKIVFDGCKGFPGINGFFARLEKKIYKVQVRVFLSRFRRYVRCPACRGTRLGPHARNVTVGGRMIAELAALSVSGLREFMARAGTELSPARRKVGAVVLREMDRRLETLVRMGVGYLALDRLARTLSGGEAQRINLACALGGELVDTLFVLEEPGAGLHPADCAGLVRMLGDLSRAGNTLCLISHNRKLIGACDNVIDMGPLAGDRGGEVVFSGPLANMLASADTLTARYLRGRDKIARPESVSSGLGPETKWLEIKGASENNLAGIDVRVPLGCIVAVTGVSGAGKSSFAENVLFRGLCSRLGIAIKEEPGECGEIIGVEALADAALIDNSPIGRSIRSTPGTYLKIFDDIRKVFASLPQSKRLGFTAGHFSFNSGAGRCPDCEGLGRISVQMQFLADVTYTCPQCGGARYRSEVLRVKYKGRNIGDILNSTADELMILFSEYQTVVRKLGKMSEAGLGYMRLGQATSTMSGGELQRLKTAFSLARGTGRCLYVFDEPGAGLHFADVNNFLACLSRLTAAGGSAVVVEHNMDIVAACDYVLDFGPGAGPDGGELVACGSPSEIAHSSGSATGRALRQILD